MMLQRAFIEIFSITILVAKSSYWQVLTHVPSFKLNRVPRITLFWDGQLQVNRSPSHPGTNVVGGKTAYELVIARPPPWHGAKPL